MELTGNEKKISDYEKNAFAQIVEWKNPIVIKNTVDKLFDLENVNSFIQQVTHCIKQCKWLNISSFQDISTKEKTILQSIELLEKYNLWSVYVIYIKYRIQCDEISIADRVPFMIIKLLCNQMCNNFANENCSLGQLVFELFDLRSPEPLNNEIQPFFCQIPVSTENELKENLNKSMQTTELENNKKKENNSNTKITKTSNEQNKNVQLSDHFVLSIKEKVPISKKHHLKFNSTYRTGCIREIMQSNGKVTNCNKTTKHPSGLCSFHIKELNSVNETNSK